MEKAARRRVTTFVPKEKKDRQIGGESPRLPPCSDPNNGTGARNRKQEIDQHSPRKNVVCLVNPKPGNEQVERSTHQNKRVESVLIAQGFIHNRGRPVPARD